MSLKEKICIAIKAKKDRKNNNSNNSSSNSTEAEEKPIQISITRFTNNFQTHTFCIGLLAKKFELQDDLMSSGNPESEFAFATIIIFIWNDSTDFGKILLAYFFKEYIIPFYPP